ncbi:MAG: hypothetical protein SGBAC_003524 [Bacillariaceae sp.]
MPEKIQGTVKWFSNRKGFGFITPSGDNSPTQDDIFVHQSNIVMEKEGTYRTIKDGMEVQFEVATDDDGKLKAQHITSADGSPCPVPEPRERRRRRKKADADSAAADDETGGPNDSQNEDNLKENANGDEKPPEKKEGRNRRRKNKKKGNSNTDDSKNENSNKISGDDDKKPPKESLESILERSVKAELESKDLKIVAGKLFIAIDDARIKLGSGG